MKNLYIFISFIFSKYFKKPAYVSRIDKQDKYF